MRHDGGVLDSLSPQRRRLVIVTASAFGVLVLVIGAIVAVAEIGGGARSVAQDEPGPVIVVPGYGGRTASLAPIVAALRDAGREVVVFKPTQGGVGDLRVQAKRLGQLAERARDSAGASSVDVIGYSAGGVIARLWVRDEGGADVARRVVTIGSPHHGTSQAALAIEAVQGACPQACVQLTPDSDLLRRLNAGDETPSGPEWVAIRSDSDQVVTPTDSASLDGALDFVVQEFCPGATTSHGALPADPVVLAALRSTLGAASPRVPLDVSC